ncbi:MAG: beta-ketoacyl-ACP synthase, partial [Myxococcales bacterium]|nr:beta-ketoacyl-ACP synthase [Myxococcales bacterium]
MSRRVVITGIGLASPIGCDLDEISEALRGDRSGIRRIPEWGAIEGLETRLGGPVEGLELRRRWPRQSTRSMGRVALLAAHATEAAIADAGLEAEATRDPRTGLAYGSTHGSSAELESFCREVFGSNSLQGITSSRFLRFTSHTCAANLAQLFGIRGRVQSTSAACVSGSQAIGAGFEAIRAGSADRMLVGGAEELHFMAAGVFDILAATAGREGPGDPSEHPRPFDERRDGLVVAEGAGTLLLEELDRARARGARVYAELLGYGTCCDGSHITAPSSEGMARCMRLALANASLPAEAIAYVNAHATGTRVGDRAESHATATVLGSRVPISSTKGATGHTLGACGALEAAFCVA